MAASALVPFPQATFVTLPKHGLSSFGTPLSSALPQAKLGPLPHLTELSSCCVIYSETLRSNLTVHSFLNVCVVLFS